MEGIIINFRRGKHTVTGDQMIVKVNSVDSSEAASKLIGKKVVYNTGKKDISGEVKSSHGNKGALRVSFETGMPGQAIGKKVRIN